MAIKASAIQTAKVSFFIIDSPALDLAIRLPHLGDRIWMKTNICLSALKGPGFTILQNIGNSFPVATAA
jgi:hypothetical protein